MYSGERSKIRHLDIRVRRDISGWLVKKSIKLWNSLNDPFVPFTLLSHWLLLHVKGRSWLSLSVNTGPWPLSKSSRSHFNSTSGDEMTTGNWNDKHRISIILLRAPQPCNFGHVAHKRQHVYSYFQLQTMNRCSSSTCPADAGCWSQWVDSNDGGVRPSLHMNSNVGTLQLSTLWLWSPHGEKLLKAELMKRLKPQQCFSNRFRQSPLRSSSQDFFWQHILFSYSMHH